VPPPAIPARPADVPPAGHPETMEPGVVRVLAPNASPYTGWGTNSWLVGTSDLAVIDPGPDDPAHLAALERAVAGRPVTAILVTHHHRDHSPLSRALAARTGAPILGAAPGHRSDGDARFDAAFDADYRPDRVLADGEAVTSGASAGGGWTLTALATPGHTSNHLCFALEGTGALFSGDHVMGWSTTVVSPPDGDMGEYLASLDKLLERDDRVYYPGHGAEVRDPRRLVRGQAGHRRQREGQLRRLLGEGAALTVPEMTARMYVGLDPRLLPAAERSVLAHLLDLERRGLVVGEGAAWAGVR